MTHGVDRFRLKVFILMKSFWIMVLFHVIAIMLWNCKQM